MVDQGPESGLDVFLGCLDIEPRKAARLARP